MEAHVAAGNRAEALRVYERCRQLLAEELGAYPSPETEAIYRSLLEAPPSRGEGEAASEASTSPGTGRRKRLGLAAAAVFVGGVIAATLAVTSHGRAAPKVLPNSVVRIDPHTLKVTQVVPVVDAPDLVVASGGFVWITSHILRDTGPGTLRNAGDRALTRLDPSDGKAEVVGGGLAPCGLTTDRPATSGSPTATPEMPDRATTSSASTRARFTSRKCSPFPEAKASSAAWPTAAAHSGSPRSSAKTR